MSIGSIKSGYGSEDPDPNTNRIAPEHCPEGHFGGHKYSEIVKVSLLLTCYLNINKCFIYINQAGLTANMTLLVSFKRPQEYSALVPGGLRDMENYRLTVHQPSHEQNRF
jgi:hypothetical protein